MILLWILALPFLAAAVAWAAGDRYAAGARMAMLLSLSAQALMLTWLWGNHAGTATADSGWLVEYSKDWMPTLGVKFTLAVDGLALLMLLLTSLTGIIVVLFMGETTRDRASIHHACIMLTLGSISGVFMAADLFLFFVFYEAMLMPAYALIAFWGSGDRVRVATRFFLFTQVGGLLMLLAIVGLHVAHLQASGVSTFAYSDLLNTALSPRMSQVFLVAFFLAFAVKLPLVPFHTWQASTYASAPTEVSILLAALMAKTAGYGLLRYALPLFPGALETVTPWAMALGVVTILYAAWMAYGQQDLKRLIAYSSAGHLGFVLLGAFSNTPLGQSGAIAVMLSHGLSVTGLFVVVGMLERRTGSTNIDSMGGIWTVSPRLGGLALALAMATLGLPGLGNFVGEFLVLAGLFPTHPWLTAFAALGAIFSAAYALRLIRNAFYGPTCEHVDTKPESTPLLFVCAFLVLALLWLGIYPKPILNAARIAYVTPVQNTSDTTADQNTAPGDHP